MKTRYGKNRMVMIILWTLLVLLALIVFSAVFVRVWPSFGGRPSKADRADYAKRAAGYFDGVRFRYPAEWGLAGLPTDERVSVKGTKPTDVLPVEMPDFDLATPDGVTVTWLGHSSVLIQMHGKTVLIDPVLGKRTSPVRWVGPARFSALSVTAADLPHIDAVLISHDHYDHLDMDTIRSLEEKTDRFIVPLGVEKHLRRWIKDDGKVANAAWWESFELDGLTITCAPANHHAGRAPDNQDTTLVCSWVLRDERHQIMESGDTGYGAHFAEIHDRFGDFDLMLVECGQYNINWHGWHMFPEESALAAQALHARAVMPIHWGAFVLSTHGWDDSPERLLTSAEEKGIAVITPRLCETMALENGAAYQSRWWRAYE